MVNFITQDLTTLVVSGLLILSCISLVFLVVKFLSPTEEVKETKEVAPERQIPQIEKEIEFTLIESYLKEIISTLNEVKEKIDIMAKNRGDTQIADMKEIKSKLDSIYKILSDISEE